MWNLRPLPIYLLMSATRLLPACGTLNAAKTDTKHIPIFGVSFPPFAKQWPRTKCLPIEIPLDKWVDTGQRVFWGNERWTTIDPIAQKLVVDDGKHEPPSSFGKGESILSLIA